MEQWLDIRQRVLREGVSKRQILRETGMHWTTLEKILEHPSPPGYRRSQRPEKPKIDPYVDRTKLHKLEDILVIVLCAVICGAETWVDIADFARAKEPWLRTFLELPHGIPSHDTFGRVFAALDVGAFEQAFQSWILDWADTSEGRLIAIDGKTIRRSLDRASDRAAIHLVSAWVYENHAVFGQLAVEGKSNEITAIPKLLERLNLKKATVTIDAIGCQTGCD